MSAEAAYLRTESSTMGLPTPWLERFEEVAGVLASTGYDLGDEIEDLRGANALALAVEVRRNVDAIDHRCSAAIQAHVRLVAELDREKTKHPELTLAWSLAACCGTNLLHAYAEARRGVEAYRRAFDRSQSTDD